MASATEYTPLIPPATQAPQAGGSSAVVPAPRQQRNVTFNPQATVAPSIGPLSPSLRSPIHTAPLRPPHNGATNQPMLSALNSKLRRRNSHGSAALSPMNPVPKIGPQRTTKTAQKLKLLPNPDPGDDGQEEESGRDVYSQFTRIKDPTARRDAARLGKADRDRLPRVTAYCTAGAYRLDGLMRFLKGRAKMRGAAPKLFDECIYTPYSYTKAVDGKPNYSPGVPERQPPQRRHSDSSVEVGDVNDHQGGDLIDLHADGPKSIGDHEHETSSSMPPELEHPSDRRPVTPDLDTNVHTPEIFLFNYGTVVIWGMSLQHEQRFLKEIAKFESEKLGKDDVQTENFNFYYTKEYQARIYNDFISLREKKNYMTKLAISHALAQSVKTSLFEDLVDNTIETTKDLPETIALTGKVNLTRRQINMQIGELFILRINIHLQGSVLDSPELMWAEPQLDPVYQAVRSYLEMDQRVGLLTERLDVIADLLAVLKDQLTHTHGEYLEWIVIVLIAAEIVVAAVNIVVDLFAAGD
ncbi:MAG: hypothetical protein M1840_005303 [Geoglossum simile]|nr:MAG: hypothetical protein M1840_005303 [Geoglossum simile]